MTIRFYYLLTYQRIQSSASDQNQKYFNLLFHKVSTSLLYTYDSAGVNQSIYQVRKIFRKTISYVRVSESKEC